MKLIRVGVDLAKNIFQVHGVDRNERAVWRRKLTRENWLKVLPLIAARRPLSYGHAKERTARLIALLGRILK